MATKPTDVGFVVSGRHEKARQGGLGLLLALYTLIKEWASAAMPGYEVAMGMPLASLASGHGLDGLKFFAVGARPFVDPPNIHEEIQVVVESQVKLPDVRPCMDAVDVSILIQSDKRPGWEVQVALQLFDSSKLFVAVFAEGAYQAEVRQGVGGKNPGHEAYCDRRKRAVVVGFWYRLFG
ncbi:hypothetical protein NHF39_22895 [Pseudomonas proteolytica]|nr:hypothetical protein [Pseudomonas proteolytica]USW94156.1 hypothetical protein NHF39_22895 [Pseudomonas proteolytica]USX01875.1 hypothetical protein NHF41_08655 [Pseudomonas proteolytica]